jgi:4-amino-4-deoxy-L-arabinose transferase-like glycosyltransferase
VACGTALRAYRLDWGLPGYNFPDDVMHFLRPAARAAAGGSWLPDGFVHPPVLVGLLAAAFRAWGAVSGQAIQLPTLAMTDQLETLTIVGRALNVGLGACSIAMVYAVARRLLGRGAGLLAAAGFALVPLHVLECHRLAPDIPALLLALVATWMAVLADEQRRFPALVGSAATAGLAAAARYTAVFAMGAPIWACARRRRGLGLLVALGVAAAAGFLVGCIPCLCRLERFLADLRLIATAGYAVDAPGVTLAGGWTQNRWVYPLLVALPYMMGWPLYLLSLAGLVALCRRNRRAAGLLLALVVPCVILIGGSRAAVPRYYLPVSPALAIAAAGAVATLAERRRALAAVLGIVAYGYTGLLAASQVARLDLAPQRAVGALIERLATHAGGTPLVVAYPSRVWLHYDAVASLIRRPDTRLAEFPPPYANPFLDEAAAPPAREWLDAAGVQVVVLPSWIDNGVMRARPHGLAGTFYAALADGSLGFRLAGDFRSHYLTEWLYTWGDPMLNTHWETAIAGYRVFVRESDGG